MSKCFFTCICTVLLRGKIWSWLFCLPDGAFLYIMLSCSTFFSTVVPQQFLPLSSQSPFFISHTVKRTLPLCTYRTWKLSQPEMWDRKSLVSSLPALGSSRESLASKRVHSAGPKAGNSPSMSPVNWVSIFFLTSLLLMVVIPSWKREVMSIREKAGLKWDLSAKLQGIAL